MRFLLRDTTIVFAYIPPPQSFPLSQTTCSGVIGNVSQHVLDSLSIYLSYRSLFPPAFALLSLPFVHFLQLPFILVFTPCFLWLCISSFLWKNNRSRKPDADIDTWVPSPHTQTTICSCTEKNCNSNFCEIVKKVQFYLISLLRQKVWFFNEYNIKTQYIYVSN